MPTMRKETAEAIAKVMDMYTGADGGIGYVKFRALVEILDAKAAAGDAASIQLIDIIRRYARLVDVAEHPPKSL